MSVARIIHGAKPPSSKLSGRGQSASNSGAGSNRSRRSIAALRSTAPLCFFRRFERLKRLERFEPSVSAPQFTVCNAFSSYGESSGTRYFFAAIFFDDFADGTSLLATNLTVFTAMS
jgi:hypothetical protein